MEFVLRIMQNPNRFLRPHSFSSTAEAWLNRCMTNWIHDYCRRTYRQRSHEVVWPYHTDEEGSCVPFDFPFWGPMPEQKLWHREFWAQILLALERLEPCQQYFFWHHHVIGVSVERLAMASGRTHAAVKQSLLRSRKQLRACLERRGWTLADLDSCLKTAHWMSEAGDSKIEE